MGHHVNFLRKVRNVCAIVEMHYEPGNYAKSYYKIWKQFVYPIYPMCYRTMLNYIATPMPRSIRNEAVQLTLW